MPASALQMISALSADVSLPGWEMEVLAIPSVGLPGSAFAFGPLPAVGAAVAGKVLDQRYQ